MKIFAASIGMFGWMLLVVVTTITAIEKIALHDEMTDDEIEQVFRTKRDAVPEYDVVPISFPKLHKRSDGSPTEIRLNALGRKVNLRLTPSEEFLTGTETPVYLARSNISTGSGYRFDKKSNAWKGIGRFFKDVKKRASFLVEKSSDGKSKIFGHVESEGWTVKPLSNRLHARFSNRYQRSITDKDDLENASTDALHVIYKRAPQSDAVYGSLDIPEIISQNLTTRSKRSVPDIIYPEILVIVDYQSFTLHGEDITTLLKYLLPFWNNVDLLFRALEKPKVRLNIAGILVAVDSEALPFLVYMTSPEKSLYADESLRRLWQYLRAVDFLFPQRSYDIAAVMTTYNLCAPDVNECRYVSMSYLNSVCLSDDKEIRSTAFIKDYAVFPEVQTAAHVFGQIFGVKSDIGNNCILKTGHSRSPSTSVTENAPFWSECAIQTFSDQFNSEQAKCLFNKPVIPKESALPRVLPGQLMTADEQCMKLRGTKACWIDENICRALHCRTNPKEMKYSCRTCGPAIDGTPCGDNKICYQSRCQTESDIN